MSFTTTGGGAWEVWDRFICIDGKPAFHIGNVCGTCEFFFRHVAQSDLASIELDELRSGLAEGYLTFNQICGKFSDVFPAGDYYAVLFEFRPKLAGHLGAPDYFDMELREAWRGVEDEEQGSPLWPYYRTEPWTIGDGARCFEFIVPLYSPSNTDPQRVDEYQKPYGEHLSPIAVALGVLDVKSSEAWPEDESGEKIQPEFRTHWCLANYLLDGHHKVLGAARSGQALRMISFISRDHSWKQVDDLLAGYLTKETTP